MNSTMGRPFYFTFPPAMYKGFRYPFYTQLTGQEYNLTQNTKWSVMGITSPPFSPGRHPCAKNIPRQT